MDSGLFIGWVVDIMAICFALSFVAHAALGRVRLWTVLATGLVPPIFATVMDLGPPPYPSYLLSLSAYMAALGSVAGTICAAVGAWLAVGARRFVAHFVATLRE